MPKRKKTLDELVTESIIDNQMSSLNKVINVRFGSVIKLISGRDLKLSECNENAEGIPYIIGASNLINNQFHIQRWTTNPTVIGKKNDILITAKGTIGKLHILEENEIHLSRQVMAIRTSEMLSEKFVFYYLLHYLNEIKAKSRGLIPGISRSDIEEISFPLYSIEDQNYIVNIIDSLFGKIDSAQQLINEAREGFEKRKEAILSKAFSGDLTKKWRVDNPKVSSVHDELENFEIDNSITVDNLPNTWVAVRLKEIAEVNPKKYKPSIEDDIEVSFIPMVSVSDITGKIEWPETRPYGKVKKGYTSFIEGDILFAKITPCMENGKSAIAKKLLNGFGFGTTEFYVIRPKMDSLREYLYYLHRSSIYRKTAKGYMTGAVGQQRVPKRYVEDYVIALPPIEEQNEIIRLLSLFTEEEYKISELTEMDEKIEMIKKSILAKAFKGELGTKGSTEVECLELLKGIIKSKM